MTPTSRSPRLHGPHKWVPCLALVCVSFWTNAPSAGAERLSIEWQLGSHAHRIHDAVYSPDGALVATASDDGTLKVWRTADGGLEMTLTLPTDNFGAPFAFYGVTFAPDGQSIWGTSVGGGYEWRVADGQLIDSIVTMETAGQVLFSRDGQLLALAGAPTGTEDTTEVYRRSDGQLLHRFEPAGSVAAVFSGDGEFLIAGNSTGFNVDNGVIRYFRLSDGQLVREIPAHAGAINWLALSPDGGLLASCGTDHSVKLWNAHSGAPIQTLSGHSQSVQRVRFSPTGDRLVSCSLDGTIILWDAMTGERLDTLIPLEQGGINAIDWSPDGRMFVLASGSQFTDPARRLCLFDLQRQAVTDDLLHFDSTPSDIAMSVDGAMFAVASHDRTLSLFDLPSVSKRWTVELPTFVNVLAFAPGGEHIVAGGGFAVPSDGRARVIDVMTGDVLQASVAHPGGIDGIAFSPDGQRLVTRSFGEPGKIWNFPAMTLVGMLGATNGNVGSIRYTPDGNRIVSAGPHAVIVSQSADGAFVRALSGHQDRTTDIAMNHDGSRVISGSVDRTAKIWNPSTGELIRTLTGHFYTVAAVAMTPNGRTVVTSAVYLDRSLRFWDVATGSLIASQEVDTGTGVSKMSFTPDGRLLLCLRNDGTVMAVRNPAFEHDGDIDGDADFDLDDAAMMASVLVGSNLDPAAHHRADINSDGTLDARDLSAWIVAVLD